MLGVTRSRILRELAVYSPAPDHFCDVETPVLVFPDGHGLFLNHSLHSSRSYRFDRPTGVQGSPSSSSRRTVLSLIASAAQNCCRLRSLTARPLFLSGSALKQPGAHCSQLGH